MLVLGALLAYAVFGDRSGTADRDRVAGASNNDAVARQTTPLPDMGRPGAVEEGEELLAVSADDARSINAARPFNTAPIPPAPPLKSQLTGIDYDRAVACLAIAGLYEAGGNADDQRPVMQVVLNRVRHPAFPHSICEVVFQGQERRTGCQFSFTCDGSLTRWRPSPAAYRQAQSLAARMLKGDVDPRVGLATHYHTDWVVPYWSASLDKIAAVKTHIFFRWNGYWGTRGAFSSRPAAVEPIVSRIAGFDAHHGPALADAEESETLALDHLPPGETDRLLASAGQGVSIPAAQAALGFETLPVAAGAPPGRWALNAVQRCGKRSQCRLVGWSGGAPAASVTRELFVADPPDFVYVQDLPNRTQQAYWNCDRFPRQGTARCLGSPAAALQLAMGG